MHTRRFLAAVWLVAVCALPAAAQQRPLITEDPETIGEGRILLEGGLDYSRDVTYPVSGLEGNLWRAPTFGVSLHHVHRVPRCPACSDAADVAAPLPWHKEHAAVAG